jgi:flagellar assembly factor FliW
MKTVESVELETLLVKQENIVQVPLGLLGFEHVKQYVLLAAPEEDPFLWLQMLDKPSQGFVVVPAGAVLPGYAPDICQQDVDFLGLKSPEDAIVLSIVTVAPNGAATANLKGPIVINRRSLVAKQVIPANVAGYSLKHPIQQIPVAA